MQIAGEIHIDEGRAALKFAQKRLLGRDRLLSHMIWPVIGLTGYLFWKSDWPGQFRQTGHPPAMLYPLLLLLILLYLLVTYRNRRVAVNAWAKRGMPRDYLATYSIETDALVIETSMYTTRIKWESISEISRSAEYWVIFGPAVEAILPRRLFAQPELETEFIADCRARLTAEARARCVG